VGKHELPRRARLLPVLGILALIVGLLAVGRFAMANNETRATDATEAVTLPSSATTDGTVEAEDPATSSSPKDEKSKAPDRGGRDKKSTAGERRKSRILRNRVEAAADGLAPDPAAFRIASFNVLGHSHTVARGNKPGYAESGARMAWTVQLLRGNDISVVGLQEYEAQQHHRFVGLTGGSWGVYPGLQLGTRGVRNSIAWNSAVWELVEGNTTTIPYFHGNPAVIPYVLLRHQATGRLAWFINVHNPASTRGNAQGYRNQATAKEVALMNQLQAPSGTDQLGVPTFLTGDFNERSEAFCSVTQSATAQAANGGTASPCSPPAGHGIDWIFGSTPGVAFSGYVRMDGGLVNRASDHPLIFSDVTLTGEAPVGD
jgi:hypothetical protein